ncbi:hypothetical protein J7F03_37190 [Streptomyces sp. ISL-43]|uniref:hypothetical protein n=1 Tax=Streptomyces sp. ISL-43 TaxID=2819183 RepID=UPI001BEAF6E6|nr:hypothetical protein [Streptomyces sp. ISL-43]MBT2452587.1 hypothetical protein [Streptomyces sp. ISL-43]
MAMPPGVQLGAAGGLAQRVHGICGLPGGAGQFGDQNLKADVGRGNRRPGVVGPRLGLQLVLGARLCQGQTLAMEHRRAMRVQSGREVGDGTELVLAVAVGALLGACGACGACRTVLEESGGQGAGEGAEYGNDRRPYWTSV